MLGTDACKAGAVNNLLHLLFKEITVQFNNKTVSDSSNMYAYRSYIENLFNLNKDIEKYRLKAEGWHWGKHDKIDEADSKNNTGLFERNKYCVNSPDIVLIGCPHSDAFHIEKSISLGIDVSIKFLPNDNKFGCMCSDADNLRPIVIIEDMNLIICTKQLSDASKVAH